MKEREKFSSRLGFILISAGCAIGLGNVWRFPYIVGQYGGALFVLIYLFFLVALGAPIMTMEFAVGRASQKSAVLAFNTLKPDKKIWSGIGKFQALGNYVLMMFYTTVGGWMLSYFVKMAKGEFVGTTPQQVESIFNNSLQDPILQGAGEGLAFYLIPNFEAIQKYGLVEIIFAAMGQAFFTLSLGIGAIAIFGSYIDKSHRLLGETISVCTLDTLVALFSGLIIFPACFAFGVNPGSGPGLVFITLPSIFNEMWLGQVWGMLFFVFMSFAALSTIIAVFENIICFAMDLFNWSRKKAVIINLIVILILSLPCALGFNILSDIAPLGAGTTIQDFEDFLVTYNFLPLGSLAYLIFCTTRYGWNFDNFIKEADTGKGLKFPKWTKNYLKYILPCIIIILFIQGYYMTFIK